MGIKKFNKYEDNIYQFPNSDIDPEEKKTPEYTKKIGEALYSMLLRDKLEVGYSDQSEFYVSRLYGRGEQPQERYMPNYNWSNNDGNKSIGGDGTDIRGSENSAESERKGFQNLRYDIISPAQKISSQLHGMIDDLDYRITLDRIDSDSGDEEENAKWDLWVEASQKPFLDQMRASAGIPPEDLDFLPANMQELDMYAAADGFKPNYIKAMQKLILHTENISDYQNIKEKHLDDLRDLGVCFMKDYFDDQSGKTKYRYVDPENYIGQYSKDNNFKDSEYAGEWRMLNVFQIRDKVFKEYPDSKEEDLRSMANLYAGYNNNPDENDWRSNYNTEDRWYDNHKVCVIDFEWIENDKDYVITSKNKAGRDREYKGKYGEVKDKKDKKTRVNMKRNRYRGTWVVGTDYVYDFGLDYDQQRPERGEVNLTYQGIKLNGKPLTKQLEPFYDQIQMTWLKYQNAMATHYDDIWAIDMRMISNISDGKGKSVSPKEIVGMMREMKVIPFLSSPIGQKYQGGSTSPITKIQGSLINELNEYLNHINMIMRQIEDIVGLNSAALGGAVNPNDPVKTTQMAVEALHTGIKPYISALFKVKEYTSKNAVLRMQLGAKYNKDFKDVYSPVVGEVDIDLIKEAQHTNTQYGLTLKAKPDEKDKANLHRSIQAAIEKGMLTVSQQLWLISALDDGEDLIEISQRLDYYTKKAQEKAQQQQQEMVVAQQREAQQKAQIDQQTKQQEAQIEYKRTMDEIRIKGEEERKTIAFERNIEYMNGLEESAALEEGQNLEVNKEAAKNVLQ